jgi:hypothetical protein
MTGLTHSTCERNVASCSRDPITKHEAMDYRVVEGRKTWREILSGKAMKLLRGAKASDGC